MEAEERPSKMRKLDSAADLSNGGGPDTPTSPNKSAGGLLAHDGDKKPAEHAEEDDQNGDEGDDDEDENETKVDVDPSSAGMDSTQPMSKNALKKLRKREEWEAGRDYRKAKRKEKMQEKKARKREAAQQEKVQVEEGNGLGGGGGGVAAASTARKRRPIRLPVTIVVDCGFDELMVDKERISLGSQITRSYADNARAPFAAHLVVSSWGGRLKERFDTVLNKHHLHWKGVRFVEADFVEAAQSAAEYMVGPRGGRLAGQFARFADEETKRSTSVDSTTTPKPASENTPATSESARPDLPEEAAPAASAAPPPLAPSGPLGEVPLGEVVYLTSDSAETLTALSPYSTYVVGGLVDKNRHKGLCHRVATERGVRTARLPIDEYMDMRSRKVLATNHVVEIMLRWLECGDWGEAFVQVIPKRKGGQLKDARQTSHDDDDAAAAENGDHRGSDDDQDGDEAKDHDDGGVKVDNH